MIACDLQKVNKFIAVLAQPRPNMQYFLYQRTEVLFC